jgi:hypothetical protein
VRLLGFGGEMGWALDITVMELALLQNKHSLALMK